MNRMIPKTASKDKTNGQKYAIIVSMMKILIWLPAVFLLGIVIGAWEPREEIRALKEKPREAEARARDTANGFQAFATLANIPKEARRPHRRKPADKPLFKAATNNPPGRAQATVAASKPSPQAEATGASATNAPPRAPRRIAPEDLRARIEEAQDLWRTRGELALAQWKEKLKLEGAAAEQFDAAIGSMNEQLYDTMQTMAELLAHQERMTPELGLRLMGDATTILAETYEKIGACVPAARRAEVSEMQIVDFIDPGVAEPLIPVQDKITDMGARGIR